MKSMIAGATALVLMLAASAHAQEPASAAETALSKCIVDSSTGKDRTLFVQWMFSALSQHPDVQNMTTVTAEQRKMYNQRVAELLERLVLVDCRPQALAAYRVDGQAAVANAFQGFGRMAAVDLMSHPAVEAEIDRMGQDTNADKWAAFVKEAGPSH